VDHAAAQQTGHDWVTYGSSQTARAPALSTSHVTARKLQILPTSAGGPKIAEEVEFRLLDSVVRWWFAAERRFYQGVCPPVALGFRRPRPNRGGSRQGAGVKKVECGVCWSGQIVDG